MGHRRARQSRFTLALAAQAHHCSKGSRICPCACVETGVDGGVRSGHLRMTGQGPHRNHGSFRAVGGDGLGTHARTHRWGSYPRASPKPRPHLGLLFA